MRLDIYITQNYNIQSRNKANELIKAKKIKVNGDIITKASFKILSDDVKIEILEDDFYVSRSAYKLKYFIEELSDKILIKDKIALDIGSSTGGFTDVLINKNAQKVYAVDVGTNQLHEKLKKNSKVINLEKMNARYLNKELFTDLIEIMVCDVSFISLKKVIGPNLNLLTDKSIIIVLIKPQFEAKKYELKKGIIRDSQIHKRICDEIKEWFETECSCYIEGIIESPIKGPKGNTEFLLIAKYQKKRKQ